MEIVSTTDFSGFTGRWCTLFLSVLTIENFISASFIFINSLFIFMNSLFIFVNGLFFLLSRLAYTTFQLPTLI